MSRRPASRPLLVVIALSIALIAAFLGAAPASAAGGSIAGKVTKPDGKPLKGSTVDLYSVDPDGIWLEKSTTTKTDGTYSFGSLARGKYVVGFASSSQTYASEFWNNAVEIERAATISVRSSKVSGINAKLGVGAKVSGRVLTDTTPSRPVADAEVIAYRLDEYGWTYGRSIVTAADGSYTLSGLSEGFWTLEFNPPTEGPDADLALEYWNDNRTFDTSAAFPLTLGTTVSGKDAHLAPGGRVSGRVTGPEGEPVVGALVFGYPIASNPEVGTVAVTDENGEYVMKGMSRGEHRLEFVDALEFDPFGDGPDYASEWWDDKGSFWQAEPVYVSAGTTSTGKNAQLDDARTTLVNTSPPTIEGQPQVDEILTADPGTWSRRVDEVTYRWFADGEMVDFTSSPSLFPTAAMVGKRLSVEVTVKSQDGQSAAVMSAPTEAVLKGVLSNSRLPGVSGVLRVGSTVSLYEGSWNKSVQSAYELLADGEPVATGTRHTLTPDLLGKRLSVRVTATRAGYDPVTVTGDESEPVTEGKFVGVWPAIDDVAPIIGVPITVGLNNSYDGPTYSYQWMANGEEIDGAEGATFTPTDAQLGKALTVRLTMTSPGYENFQTVSSPSEAVIRPDTVEIESTHVPRISGDPVVSNGLTASTGAWEPQPSSFAYQWLAGGAPIPNATAAVFAPTSDLLGKRISVRVTAIRPGYISASATSPETEPIAAGTPFGAPHDFRSTGNTETSIDLAWTEVYGAVNYRVFYRPEASVAPYTTLDLVDVTSTRITGLKTSTQYEFEIAAIGTNGVRSPGAHLRAGTTSAAALGPPKDLRVTSRTSSSLTLAWTKVSGVPKYRIYHGIGSGTRTKTEVGDVNTVTIKGLKSGKTYSIDIASLLKDGTRSSYSPRITATTN